MGCRYKETEKRAIKARKRYEAVVYQIRDSGVSPHGDGGPDGVAPGSRFRAELR